MKTTHLTASIFALLLATAPAVAQAPAPPAPSTPPGASAPAAKATDAAAEAKFTTADKDKSGSLDGAELDAFKADMAKIDTNGDGKISKEEYVTAMKAGVVK